MNRVVIAARTHMRGDRVCIGGHDLDQNFRPVRLLDLYGDHWTVDSSFQVGDVWLIRYRPKVSARPPHVEDVFVQECRHQGKAPDLKELVQRTLRPWAGSVGVLFDGTVRTTPSGSPHIPSGERLPRCSTGYWIPDRSLARRLSGNRARYGWPEDQGDCCLWCTWVGVQEPPEQIESGSLVRVSLSRLFRSETAPEGYYMQISGVL